MLDLSGVKPKDLWYVVGWITTDGCLSSDKRHTTITSKDKDILETIKSVLKINNKICNNYNGQGDLSFKINICSIEFYKFLESIGLTQRKSLTLCALKIPDEYFCEFLRGVIDGDGCINYWIHNKNGNIQWALRFTSAASVFSEWLKEKIEDKFRVRGRSHIAIRNRKNHIYIIKFGKLAAKVILSKYYYKNCIALERKRKIAESCIKTKNLLKKYGNVINYA